MSRRNPKDLAVLTGFDANGTVVFEESIDLHTYWDGLHPVIDDDEFRRSRSIVRLTGVLYGGARNVLQEFENRYGESGEIVASTARHADGTTTNLDTGDRS